MRISADARERDIEPAVNWVSCFIGAAVDNPVLAYEQRERGNPRLTSYFRNNFALEFALAEARKYKKITGRVPKGNGFDFSLWFPDFSPADLCPASSGCGTRV